MNALYLLSLLQAVSMARIITTESNHAAVELLDRPNGSSEALVLFNDPHLEVFLKAHLESAKEWLGL